jgi:hypothetical protein
MLEQVRRLACTAAVASAMLVLATPAQASISVTITDEVLNVSKTYSSVSNAATVGTPTGGINLGFFSNLNVTITPVSTSNSLTVFDTNITGKSNFADTLSVTVSISGITVPTGQVSLTSSLGGSSLGVYSGGTHLTPPSGFATFSSSVPSANLSSPSSGNLVVYGLGNGIGVSATPGGANGGVSSIVSGTVGTGYTLKNALSIAYAANGSSNINATTTLTATATPEPSTMAIAGLGALGMIGYGLRRRKAKGA